MQTVKNLKMSLISIIGMSSITVESYLGHVLWITPHDEPGVKIMFVLYNEWIDVLCDVEQIALYDESDTRNMFILYNERINVFVYVASNAISRNLGNDNGNSLPLLVLKVVN